MSANNRDITIVKKILKYCFEIDDAHTAFHNSYENFKTNSVYKNAVCLCLMQIGELTNKLSEDFKANYSNIPWRQIRGMRNVVAHEYGHIDDETVWETIEESVPALQDFCITTLNFWDKQEQKEQEESSGPTLTM